MGDNVLELWIVLLCVGGMVILLALLLVVSSGAMAMTAGTYEAEAQGMMGMVKVAVTVTDTAIENVLIAKQIESAQKKVETYRGQLERKFSNMELIISQMQQNYSSFLSG